MSSQTPTAPSLNPNAPEYTPRAAPPSFFHPPPYAAAPLAFPPPSSPSLQQPQSFCLSTQTFTYIQQPLFNNYTTYYFSPQNPNIATNPPPPPHTEAAITGERRGIRGFKFERRPRNNERKSLEFSMQKKGDRHKVMHLKRDEERTTIMIKNIPYDCPRKELIILLDNFCLLENTKSARNDEGTSRSGADENFNNTAAYDFLYLPIDFRTRKSRGFAFVNFTNARTVWKFFDAFHLKKWDFGSSDQPKKWTKKIEIVSAKIQGKEALVNHFSQSVFECGTDEFLPVCFDPPRDGTGQPVQLTAIGTRRSRSHRA
ncbi:hypothetical protein CDL12_21149 [Handroanthus impetiginosus]|uniref:Mei2-like C-terminal RNA recognition motif domain-containing protein n=1 Tax=Handroanthus impetiginosus TaxID=429701 RepID=A0A2G9GM02_9LAMI|nr:hypothetical protein CDL12_21149 [Handroanthus impetiginosus]